MLEIAFRFRTVLLLCGPWLAGCGVVRSFMPTVTSTPRGGASASTRPGTPTAPTSPPRGDASASTRPGTPTAPGAELARLPDDGITDEVHRAYVGQIVFATEQIPKQGADASKLGSEFYADELLYGRAYLPHSIENVAVYEPGSARPLRTETRGYRFRLHVDGKPVGHELESRTVPVKRRRSTTLQVWPHPARGDEPTPRGWVELVNELPPGAHQVRVELWAQDRWRPSREPLAVGEITLHKPADVRLGTGQSFADLDRGMTDPALSRQLLAIARGFSAKHRWKETMTEVAIRSPAWIEVRHEKLRHVFARRLLTWTRAEWPDGRCTAQALLFEQQVKAGKPHGPIYVGSSGEQRLLDCQPIAIATVDRWRGRTRTRPTPTSATGRTDVATAQPAPVPSKPTAAPPTVARATPAPTAPRQLDPAPPRRLDPPLETTARARESHTPTPGRFSLGLGVAANALDAVGVASYAHGGAHLGRLELGLGATWPLNAFAYARVAIISGRFELAPMLSGSVLGETNMQTTTAVAGGVSAAYRLTAGRVSTGIRIDALVSYNTQAAAIAVPVIGSTYVRF